MKYLHTSIHTSAWVRIGRYLLGVCPPHEPKLEVRASLQESDVFFSGPEMPRQWSSSVAAEGIPNIISLPNCQLPFAGGVLSVFVMFWLLVLMRLGSISTSLLWPLRQQAYERRAGPGVLHTRRSPASSGRGSAEASERGAEAGQLMTLTPPLPQPPQRPPPPPLPGVSLVCRSPLLYLSARAGNSARILGRYLRSLPIEVAWWE